MKVLAPSAIFLLRSRADSILARAFATPFDLYQTGARLQKS
jgi:hypothetical protein